MVNSGAVDRSPDPLSSTWAKQLVEAMPIPMFVVDAQHRLVYWNTACEKLTGVPAGSLLGTTRAWSAFYPGARPVLADLALTGSRPEDLERY
ncbi:MAG: PAS domain-containing protein, partial [Candidatus Accumulibacter sp.]|nr:PAS domain-containing protein [Accumulibacter sp.]